MMRSAKVWRFTWIRGIRNPRPTGMRSTRWRNLRATPARPPIGAPVPSTTRRPSSAFPGDCHDTVEMSHEPEVGEHEHDDPGDRVPPRHDDRERGQVDQAGEHPPAPAGEWHWCGNHSIHDEATVNYRGLVLPGESRTILSKPTTSADNPHCKIGRAHV